MSADRTTDITVYFEAAEVGGVTKVLETLLQSIGTSNSMAIICRDSPGVKRWAAEGVPSVVQVVPTALRNRADLLGWFDIARIFRNIRIIRKTKILHCHLHTPFSCIPIIILAGMFSHAQIITTEHYISQIKYLRRRRLSPVKALLREAKVFTLMFLKRVSFHFIRTVVTVSDSNRDFMISTFGKLIAPKLQSIPNGIDIGKYSQPWGKQDTKRYHEQASPLVVTVAGLNNQKGHEYLLRAIPSVMQKRPGTRFTFVGDGHLRQYLEELAASLGIAGAVEFLGWRSDVSSILQESDLFVLPSLFEGLPLSLIEAMAAGMPVVATDVDGTHDVVVDGITGFLVPPKNPDKLADRIITLLTEPEMRERFGRAGRERVQELYSAERMVSDYMRLFSEIIGAEHFKHGQ